MNSNRTILSLICLTALLFLVQASAHGQSVWMQQYTGDQNMAGLEAMFPSFDGGTEAPTSAWYLFGKFPAGDNLSIRVDIPISHVSFEGGIDSETNVGNPYIGLNMQQSDEVDLDFGIRLPLAPDDGIALFSGALSDIYRIGAYAPQTYTVSATLNYRSVNESGLILRLGGGPDFFKEKDFDGELFLRYYGQVMYTTDDLTFGGGYISQLILTESGGTLEERSISSLGFSVDYAGASFRPGVYFQLPLDDGLNDNLDFVVGLNLAFLF